MNFINILRKLHTLLEKEELLIYGHLQRMNSNRLTETIFKYIRKLKMGNIWIIERTPFKSKLHHFKGFQEKPSRKTGALWTKERRGKHRETMRDMEGKKGRNQLKQA